MRKLFCIALLTIAGCTNFNAQAIHDAYDTEMEFVARYSAWVDAEVAAGHQTADWGAAEHALLKAHADLVASLEKAVK
jgi:hypothetical protein